MFAFYSLDVEEKAGLMLVKFISCGKKKLRHPKKDAHESIHPCGGGLA
jgi:hypothetical protein